MISCGKGSIFTSGCEAIVNPVNCVGVSGAGLAKAFKIRFPESYAAYRAACVKHHSLKLGSVFVDPVDEGELRFVVYFPTKHHWLDVSEVASVESGMASLVAWARRAKVKSVGIPALGCGLGGLDWEHVRPVIDRACESLERVKWLVYPPQTKTAGMMIFSK